MHQPSRDHPKRSTDDPAQISGWIIITNRKRRLRAWLSTLAVVAFVVVLAVCLVILGNLFFPR
jgi:hypothetical protein